MQKCIDCWWLLVDTVVLIRIWFLRIIYQVNSQFGTSNPQYLKLPWVGMQGGKHAGCTLKAALPKRNAAGCEFLCNLEMLLGLLTDPHRRKETQTKAMAGPVIFCWARFFDFKSMCIDLAINGIWSKFKHQHKPGDILNITITELLPTSSCSAFPSASCNNTDAAFCNAFVTALISSVTLFLSWISAFTESLWSWAFLYNLCKITRKNTLI